MEIFKIANNKNVYIGLLLFAGIALRLLPHAPNFTAIGAIALFGGVMLSRKAAVILPVVMMAMTDMVIGFYPGMIYTWLAFAGVATFGMLFRNSSFLSRTLVGGIGGSVIFFVVSNVGVWIAGGIYPATPAGLVQCFVMAIPFFGPTLASGVIFGGVLFGAASLAGMKGMLREKAFSIVSLMIKYTHVKNI